MQNKLQTKIFLNIEVILKPTSKAYDMESPTIPPVIELFSATATTEAISTTTFPRNSKRTPSHLSNSVNRKQNLMLKKLK